MATAHTHGRYFEPTDDNKKNKIDFNNEFSGTRIGESGKLLPIDNRKSVTETNDIGNANTCQLDSYLASPNGSLQRYDVKTGNISVISKDMPSDPNDPNRVNNRGTIELNPISSWKMLEIQRKIMYQQF